MTAGLLHLLGRARGSLSEQLVAALVVLALLPLAVGLDALAALGAYLRARRVLHWSFAHCPGGHEVALIGAWQCTNCKLMYEGHGFAPCPHCSHTTYAVLCACSRPVINPLYPVEKR